MFSDDDDDDFEEGSDESEPTPSGLANWVAEQYAGDDRFESIEVQEPGPLDEEAVRVRFNCDGTAHFMLAVLADDAIVRVGLATDDKALVERIEAAAEEIGGALTDLLADGAEAEEDLEHEVEHWHDDVDYFCSDLHYRREGDLSTDVFRDEAIYYLDAYIGAFYDLVFEEE